MKAPAEKNYLVTGATGFIGSEVFCRLVKRGIPLEKITLLVRKKPFSGGSLFSYRLKEHGLESIYSRIRFIETDFENAATFRAGLERLRSIPDWVILHMAAIIRGKGETSKQERLNIGVTGDLLDWARTQASHLVYTSSVVAFGGSVSPAVRTESDFAEFPPESMHFDYFRTKRESHLLVLGNAEIPASVLCPGVVHGSLENFKDSRPHLQKLRDGSLRLSPGGGGNFVALDRVAEAHVAAAVEAPPRGVETRLLVEKNLSFKDYFETYLRLAQEAGVLESEVSSVRELPLWAGQIARPVHRFLKPFGVESSLLDGLAQASLFLYFQSSHAQPATEGFEAALRKSLAPLQSPRPE